MPGAILGRSAAAPPGSRPGQGSPRTPNAPPRPATGGRPRVRALLSVANREGIAGARPRAARPRRRDLRDRRHARAPRRRRRRGRVGLRPDPGRRRSSAARSRRSTPPSTPGSSPAATSRASSPSSRSRGSGTIDLVVVNVKPFAPAVGRQARRDRRGDRDDRRRRGRAARRRGPQLRPASRPSPTRRTTRRSSPSCASSAMVSAETRAQPRGRGVRHGRRLPRRDRGLPQPDRRATSSRSRLAMVLEKVDDLRYGENPHQRAAFYRETTHRSGTLADATQLQGEPPSFNNLLDLDAAYRIARDYTAPTVAIVKHTDPVGLASHDELVEAYRHALETDPVASFGGIVGVNRELDGATAREIAANSYEAVVAPGLQPGGARDPARRRPASSCSPSRPTRPRACATTASPTSTSSASPAACSSRRSTSSALDRGQLQVVTAAPADARGADRPAVRLARRPPRALERDRPRPQRRDGRHRRRPGQPPGVGRDRAAPGRRPGEARGHGIDAYFPFPDGIQVAAGAGVTAIIQPGGSIRDEMAIEVADRHHLAMVFTGRRHFRH